MTPRPPRFTRWLLSRAVPRPHRVVLLGDLDEEFRVRTADGTSPAVARRWYRRQAFGSIVASARWRWDARARPTPAAWLAPAAADVRFGARLLRRHPATTAAAVLTLGAGIAVATAVLSVSHAVLLRPLPYASPDDLLVIEEVDTEAGSSGGNLSWLDLQDYRERTSTLTSIAGFSGGSRTLTGAGPAERVTIAEVTDDFFATLGVRPDLGRDFVPSDADRGASPVVILTDVAWRSRFGADPAIVGRTIDLSGSATRVIGVLPSSFAFPLRGLAEMFLPVHPSDAQLERRYFHWIDAIARRRAGASLEDVRVDLGRVAAGFAAVDPEYHGATGVTLTTLSDRIVGDVRPMLMALLAAAALLLGIACSGVSGLLVARSASRARELTVRAALGASRSRLVRQLLTEGILLSAGAAVVGVVGAFWLVRGLVALLPDAHRASLPHLDSLGLDPRVALAGVAIAALAACGSSLVPAARLLRRGGRLETRPGAGLSPVAGRMQAWLVAGQVAIAVVLLVGAGLMARSVVNLSAVSPGFDSSGLLTMRLTLSPAPYRAAAVTRQFHTTLLERVDALPGVLGASTINQLPLTGRGNTGTFRADGETEERPQSARVRTVTANYFDVLSVPVLKGRRFGTADTPDSPPVVLVSETLDREMFGGQAVGRRITFPWSAPDLEIVGVVGDERFDGIEQPFAPVVYFDYGQSPERAMSLVVRTAGDAAALAGPVRAIVADLDREVPVFAVRTMDAILGESESVFRRRAVLSMVGVFGAAALLLAVVGLAGSVSRAVAERTREFGVRLTLGARGGHIAGLVLRRGLLPAAAGLALGLAGSLAFGRVLSAVLFETTPSDPATLGGVAAILLLAAGAAAGAPAWRAMHIDPVRALRDE